MPEISRFYGIVIYMYFRDHSPPHFHAKYSGNEAVFLIEDLKLVRGELPRRALNLVLEWAELHQTELREAWQDAQKYDKIRTIDPLP